MGLFCLANGSPGKETVEDLVDAAIGNLEIFKEELKYDSTGVRSSYLLAFAVGYIKDIEKRFN